MALAENDLAILTARFGCARFGASRFGFIPCPEDVHGTGAEEPGEYIWKEVKPPTTSWMLQTEDCICGQRPVASFSNILCNAVGPVSFLDTSTPAEQITFWYWDFGDGGTSNDQNPTHIYAAGFYTVTLYVSGDKGTSSATGYVSVMSALVATAVPNPASAGQDVTFTPAFTGGLAPYTYLWDFGDGLPTVNLTDLYGYWPLDEASGNPRASTLGTAPDLAEDGGAVSEIAGRFTNAITNTEINPGPALEAALAPALGIATGLTVSFWFNMPAWVVANAKTLFSLRNAGAEPFLIVYRYFNSDFLEVGFRYGANYLTLPLPRLGNFTEGDWHLLVVRYDATTGKLEGMVDDGCFSSATDWTALPLPAEKLSAIVAPASLAALNAITFDILTVGKAYDGNHVNGGCAIDDLRIWTRALTDDEVADLWHRSDEETPTYSYGEDGVQTVTATVTSATGCTITDTVDVTVNEAFSVTWVVADNEGGIAGESFSYEFTPTIVGGTAPYTYAWDFSDGEADDTNEVPTQVWARSTWTNPDDIPVTLTVTDATLATAVYSADVTVTFNE